MSFALTTEQVRRGEKTVTRRTGWEWARPGMLLLAVEKGQGLKAGEKVRPIRTIRVVSVRRERLDKLMEPGGYGSIEMVNEGFPGADPAAFVLGFAARNEIDADFQITRIEFAYVGSGK